MQLPIRSAPLRRRGSVIIGTLFFILIFSILLMGIGQFAVSHQTRAKVDADWAAALDIAEAGINYEFGKISVNPANADQSPGASYSFGGGTFSVKCIQRNADGSETAPWVAPNNLYVYATGTIRGVSRTVKVSAKGHTIPGDFAVYGIHSVDLGSNSTVIGNVGSNGAIIQGNSCSIAGIIYLNGPNASYSGPLVPQTTPVPILWPTVDKIANDQFPQGGLTWLATNNDNASAGIVNNQINGSVTLSGKSGGANYYVTSITLSGSQTITFDNTLGPVNLWIGPSGGGGSVKLVGTTQGITTDITQGGNPVNIYIATAGTATLDMRGTSTIKANIYDYNRYPGTNTEYGSLVMKGTPDVYGSVVAYDVAFSGTPGVQYVEGVQQPPMIGYFGYDNSWIESNRR
jgi:hypothetical protein